MKGSDYIVFDFETGGKEAKKNPIIEVAMYLVDRMNLKLIDKIEFYIKPYDGLIVEKEALKVNGIKMSDVEADGFEKKEAFKVILAFLKKANNGKSRFTRPIMVAHNASFDMGFLEEFFLLNKDNIFNYVYEQFVCTQERCKEMEILDSLKLSNCCEHFGIKITNAHRAGGDVEATIKLFKALIDRVRNALSGTKEKKQKKTRTNFQF